MKLDKVQYTIALKAKDAVSFSQKFMFDYVSFIDGQMLYKDDLVQGDDGKISKSEDASKYMKVLNVCASNMIFDPITEECTPCPANRGTLGLDNLYCISCGDMWVNNRCEENDNQPACYQAQLICPDPLLVFMIENGHLSSDAVATDSVPKEQRE